MRAFSVFMRLYVTVTMENKMIFRSTKITYLTDPLHMLFKLYLSLYCRPSVENILYRQCYLVVVTSIYINVHYSQCINVYVYTAILWKEIFSGEFIIILPRVIGNKLWENNNSVWLKTTLCMYYFIETTLIKKRSLFAIQ